MRIKLYPKLLFFSIILAVVPLFIAGRAIIRISQDELKSSANESLSNKASEVVARIDERFEDAWVGPLELVRTAIDSEYLGPQEKLSILGSGLQEIADVVALQLSVEGVSPALVSREYFTERLRAASLDPSDILLTAEESMPDLDAGNNVLVGNLQYIAATDDWLATFYMPLHNRLLGRQAMLSARIDMNRLRTGIASDPLNQKGEIYLVDKVGARLFDPEGTDMSVRSVVRNAMTMNASEARVASVEPYQRENGARMLAAVANVRSFPWIAVVELSERDAYLAISEMRKSLLGWILLGLGIATFSALFVSWRISSPIVRIDKVAQSVSKGDLQVRVEGVKSNDEIGDLANRVNEMIQGLLERFNLEKFVSGETIAAVKGATGGVKLGGERRHVTVLFSDIRGFTAFSEQNEPETVVEMLNLYLRHQAYIVTKYHGDIDKYVGDELVAVFVGPQAAINAVRCAVEIQDKMRALTASHPEWDIATGIGINSGDVVMGAMGSEQRMDFTILGDSVNLGARLCSKAGHYQTLLSSATYAELGTESGFVFTALSPMQVKGKTEPISVYQVDRKLEVLDAVNKVPTATGSMVRTEPESLASSE